ncbi:response regulator transcription factor [Sphingosinicella sp. BN140058]|uniref:response regulator transcription factor n=1 Tax=Sphingosinicella sp. BN140058 TaxID=1892855 RepID=UPI0010139BC9|nr:response regulator transcription factor [Sphingosinicella sp. BN140058]QAY79332.1 response regulator transcription factor [Sphingosinicella sp. BN140058]
MRVGIVTSVRLLAEAMTRALAARPRPISLTVASSLEELHMLARPPVSVQLGIIDTTQSFDLEPIRAFHRTLPDLPLVALGLVEGEAEVVAHGSAGFCAYVRREDGLERLCGTIEDAIDGRLRCSPEIAAAMMRGLFRSPAIPPSRQAATARAALTSREQEVARLVSRALSNKEIARELRLSESTVKQHVHSILGKLGVATRGQLARSIYEDFGSDAALARTMP